MLLTAAADSEEIREEVQLFVDRYRSKKGEDTAAYYLALGRRGYWERDLERAAEGARKAVSLYEHLVEGHLLLAAAYSGLDLVEESLSALEEGSVVAPPHSIIHF